MSPCTGKVLLTLLYLFLASNAGASEQNTLAYSGLTEGYWQIWLMEPETGKGRQLTHSPVDKREPAWDIQGRLFYRTTNGALFLIDADGSDERPIAADLQQLANPVSHPFEPLILLTRHRVDLHCKSDLWMLNLGGAESERHKFARLPGTECIRYQPAWFPDGRQIAYAAGNEPEEEEAIYHIWVTDKEGKEARPLTSGQSVNLSPNVSPKGDAVAFSSNRSGDYEIWVMDVAGQSLRQLTYATGLDSDPVWSADGEQIMFVSNRDGRLGLWLMNADGSSQKKLTPADQDAMDPAWFHTR